MLTFIEHFQHFNTNKELKEKKQQQWSTISANTKRTLVDRRRRSAWKDAKPHSEEEGNLFWGWRQSQQSGALRDQGDTDVPVRRDTGAVFLKRLWKAEVSHDPAAICCQKIPAVTQRLCASYSSIRGSRTAILALKTVSQINLVTAQVNSSWL